VYALLDVGIGFAKQLFNLKLSDIFLEAESKIFSK